MNPYKRTNPVHGVCEHARSEWVTGALVVLGLFAGALLVKVVA